MHYVIIIPGLGNRAKGFKFITSFWNFFGLTPIVKLYDWRDEDTSYDAKFIELNNFIDSLDSKENKISLVGCSAGGSAAINLFCANKNKIHKVINVCGRLFKHNLTGWSNFEERTKTSKKFRLSVEKCEENIKGLTLEDKNKILTLYPLFGDEVVPIESMKIDGAKSDPLFSIEHMITITLALTVYFYKIKRFL